MTTIYARTQDQVLVATILPKVACNNKNTVKLHVDFDSVWNGYTKSALFHTSNDPTVYPVPLSAAGECTIPHEVLADAGHLFISIQGLKTGSSEIKSTTALRYKILPGTPSLVVSDPTPGVYQQLLTANTVLGSRMSELEAAGTVEGSEVIGIRTGADGTVYDNAGDAVRAQVAKKADKNAVNNFYGLDIFTRGVTNLYPHGDISMDYTGGTWKNATSTSFSLAPGTYTMLVSNIELGVSAFLEYVGGQSDVALRIVELNRIGFYTFEVTRGDLDLQIRMLVSKDADVTPGTYGIYGVVITAGITNTEGLIPEYLTGVDKKLDRKVGKNLFDKNSKDIVYYKHLSDNGDVKESTN